jgi:hypothetical protein
LARQQQLEQLQSQLQMAQQQLGLGLETVASITTAAAA